MINHPDKNHYQLGTITYFYESGKRNIVEAVGIISSGAHDPGGKSYGIFQFASNTTTLKKFIDFFKQYAHQFFVDKNISKLFDEVKLAATDFDEKWRKLAVQAPHDFADIQRAFISESHFEPLFNYLVANNICPDKITPAIQEALWSLGVQHGKALMILRQTLNEVKTISDEQTFITHLYNNRAKYIQQLSTLNAHIKASLCARYEKEKAEIFVRLIQVSSVQ